MSIDVPMFVLMPVESVAGPLITLTLVGFLTLKALFLMSGGVSKRSHIALDVIILVLGVIFSFHVLDQLQIFVVS